MPAVSILRFEREILELYEPPLRKPATRKQVRQVLREFRELPGVKKTSDLGPPSIAKWIKAHPDRSSKTCQSLLRCWRAVLGYAVGEGYLRQSPFAYRDVDDWIRADARPVSRPHPGSRSIGEVTAVLELADERARGGRWEDRRLRALVYTYAYLGLRAGEAQHLWATDVDLDAATMHVQCHPEDRWTPKTLASAALLPIAEPLADVLREWLADCDTRWLFPGAKRRGPWVSGSPGSKPLDHVRELGRAAGVDDLCIASFRKTLGTYAKTWGLGPLELKALLRHTQTKTQNWYDDKTVDSVRPAASKVAYPRLAKTG